MILGLIIALVITKGNLDITNAKSHNENSQTFKQRFQKNVTDSRKTLRFQKNVTDLVEEYLT